MRFRTDLPDSNNTKMATTDDYLLVSMGMFIIDDICYPESWNEEPKYDIIGGAGPFCIAGSRIVAGPQNAHRIGGIVDKGRDFPSEVELQLASWGTGIIFRRDNNRLTTRGINFYDKDEVRYFEYSSPKKRIEASDILANDRFGTTKSIHIISSIDRCESIVHQLRGTMSYGSHSPIFIFEPLPDDCISKNYESLARVLPYIDIFSPNLEEATRLAGLPSMPNTKEELEKLSQSFFSHLPETAGCVIRCGKMGCNIRTSDLLIMLPAYYSDQSKVPDVTGGGNLFCGGFVTGYCMSKGNWKVAGVCGNLASGCIIESLGMPTLTTGQSECEAWNGIITKERLENYKAKIMNTTDIAVEWEQLDWL